VDSLGRISIELRFTLPATPRARREIRQGDPGGGLAAGDQAAPPPRKIRAGRPRCGGAGP
jgi:hypothetical protein